MKITRREFLPGAVAAAVLPRAVGGECGCGECRWWDEACREIAEGRVPAMDIVVSDRYRILGGLDERLEPEYISLSMDGDEWGDLANIWDGVGWIVGFGDDDAGYRKVESAAVVDEREAHPIMEAQLKRLIQLWGDAQG